MIKAEDFKWSDRVDHLFRLGSYLCLSGALTDCFLPLECVVQTGYEIDYCRFGFPEVLIGLMPGGAGTQRLPRVAGLLNALEMITTGNLVSAEKALGMGIIDKVCFGIINHIKYEYK